MNLYPAIDLYEGKVVRLKRGDYQAMTVYSDHPEEIAAEWEAQGACWLHVVDLEGARDGEVKNLETLEKIRKKVKCKIQFGGGLRNEKAIADVIKNGADRAIIGTKALDKDFLKKVQTQFREKIAIGLDIKDGEVRLEGWLKTGGIKLRDAVLWLNDFSVETLIYTDIQKDGMLEGANFSGLKQLLEWSRARVILSGGVGDMRDITAAAAIRHKNFDGLIIGKALYEKKIELNKAIQEVKQTGSQV